ncbi:unnamed protein product [Ilex paraguariensis]|uniref:Growth-regulating factor n=1 Tax=Ilex paraguariensis TaxID=185542 RepID=A0ABC8STJ7_9AQUA
MAATLGFPFTSAQWKELEIQAMIYKYMVASVPVPPDLLLPITRNLPADPAAYRSPMGGTGSSVFNLRYSSNKDLEPGRCKRTDGKKWRCSRDVAPNQKYCERHMNRGRPRSRKHVEVHSSLNNVNNNNKKKTCLNRPPLHTTPTATPNPTVQSKGSSSQLVRSTTIQANETPLLVDTKADLNFPASYNEPRSLDWMEGEMVTMDSSAQEWLDLVHANLGLANSSAFRQHYGVEESLNLYEDFNGPVENQQNDESNLFLNTELVSMERLTQIETSRGFIDAWSNDNPNTQDNNSYNESSVSSHGNLSPSSLTLSMAMAAGESVDEKMGMIKMGLGLKVSDEHKTQVSSWQSPGPWVASTTPGGPLAEALRPVSAGSNPESPHAGNGDSVSPPPTTVSSPSGVLHRTMLSLSDSSGSNSPTGALRWLN